MSSRARHSSFSTASRVTFTRSVEAANGYTWRQGVAIATATLGTASGGNGTYALSSVTPPLSAGLAIVFLGATLQITGTPTVAGVSTLHTIIVTDTSHSVPDTMTTVEVRLTVVVASINQAVQPWLQNAAITPFIPVLGSGGQTPYTYSVAPSLPSGMSMGASTGSVSGTPIAVQASTAFTVTITDSVGGVGGSAVNSFTASVTASGPNWISSPPNLTFTQGTGIQTYSLAQHTSGVTSAYQFVVTPSGTQLPSWVTLNASTGLLSIDTTNVGTISNVTYDIATVVTGVAADFAARATGAYFAENFSAYADSTAWYNFWNRGSLIGVWTPKNPSMGSTWTNAFDIITTAGHVLSGKALRQYMGKNPSGNDGQGNLIMDSQYCGFPLNGDPTNINGAFKTKMYVQICFWTDEFVDYLWRKLDGNAPGTKFFGIDQWNSISAGDLGETVVDGNLTYPGFLTGYRQTSGSTPWERGQATPTNNSNIAGQGGVDTGSALDGTEASYRRRYGPMYSGTYSGLNQASLLHTQGVPEANAAIGGVAINRGGITVVEVECDSIAHRNRVWAAWYGNAPKLVFDSNIVSGVGSAYNYTFPSSGPNTGQGWSGVWLTNLIYQASEALNPGRPVAPYVDYSELIVHPNPINFPNGFVLP